MDHVLEPEFHVVAQIVEAELVVGAVSDVAEIGLLPLHVVEVVDDDADGQAEKTIDLAHPLGVAPGEVIVDRDHVHSVAGQCIEINGEGRDQRLAFAGLHLGDHAAMQYNTAHQLHVEMALPQGALRRLPHGRESVDQDVVELGPIGELLLELLGPCPQLVIGHRFELRLQFVDGGDDRPQALDVTVIGGAEQAPG